MLRSVPSCDNAAKEEFEMKIFAKEEFEMKIFRSKMKVFVNYLSFTSSKNSINSNLWNLRYQVGKPQDTTHLQIPICRPLTTVRSIAEMIITMRERNGTQRRRVSRGV